MCAGSGRFLGSGLLVPIVRLPICPTLDAQYGLAVKVHRIYSRGLFKTNVWVDVSIGRYITKLASASSDVHLCAHPGCTLILQHRER
jgi:hypothetical protein